MLPFRGPFPQISAQDDNLEDYRSVIDDLTVRNKMLKAKLKRFEKQKQALDTDKLIEIKMHGLPDSKKRELEETLKTFVRGLDHSAVAHGSSVPSEPSNLACLSTIVKPGSSHTSTKFADSGYGSLATSAHGLSNRASQKLSNHAAQVTPIGVEASKARDRSIQSYLHDIPEGLLPRQAPVVMTQAAKKKLVVSRIEHLFSGRGADVDGHQQPIQQQEVSQSAARDDRSAIEAKGQRAVPEGKREAGIMSSDLEEITDVKDQADAAAGMDGVVANAIAPRFLDRLSEEQRPTRPLDLDPHRAQDPRENIDYLRHLGFSIPGKSTSDSPSLENDWLYLNLVMNMAQLHTLNVTTDLVRQAINDYSTRFELSADGRKLRWRVNPLAKPFVTDIVTDLPNVSNIGFKSYGHNRKRVRPQGSSSMEASDPSTTKRVGLVGSSGRSQNLTPHVSQLGTSEGNDDAEMMDSPSLPSDAAEVNPTTRVSSTWNPADNMLAQPTVKAPSDDGLMVFYRQQRFFTDMSGDRSKPIQDGSNPNYRVRSMRPLGTQVPSLSRESSLDSSSTIPNKAPASHSSLDVHADDASNFDALSIHSDKCRVSFVDPFKPYHFEASGVGCVYPSDNFALYVTRELEVVETPPHKRRKISKLQDVVPTSSDTPETSIVEKITSIKGQFLEPSPLPPPTYAVSACGSESGSDDEDENSSYEYTTNPTPSAYAHTDVDSLLESTIPSSEEPEEDGQEPQSPSNDVDASSMSSENSSEPEVNTAENIQRRLANLPSARSRPEPRSRPSAASRASRRLLRNEERFRESRSPSLDLLASARQADPEAIRQREREYDAELAEKLAEEMPAGSSAATCGGQPGSGNCSPVEEFSGSSMDIEDEEAVDDGASALG